MYLNGGILEILAANTAGENNPTSPEESVVVKGKAAKLQSTWIGFIGIGAFASASMFTGNFVDIDGTEGILSFGQSIYC